MNKPMNLNTTIVKVQQLETRKQYNFFHYLNTTIVKVQHQFVNVISKRNHI